MPDETARWRARLVGQFEDEGRGPGWVVNGTLQRRVKGMLYSPNFPGKSPKPPPTPRAGCDRAPGAGTT